MGYHTMQRFISEIDQLLNDNDILNLEIEETDYSIIELHPNTPNTNQDE